MYILDPIYKVFDCIMNFKKDETDKLLDKLGKLIWYLFLFFFKSTQFYDDFLHIYG